MGQGSHTQLHVELAAEDRAVLESWQRSTTVQAGLAKRGRIILLLAEGHCVTAISRRVGLARRFVYKWVDRFNRHGVEGLYDKSGRGRKAFFPSRGGDPSGKIGLRAAG